MTPNTTTTPIMQKIELTQEGYDEMVAELAQLKNKHQPAVDRVALARSYGDLTENAEYQAAREDLSFLDSRIEELENVIAQSKVIKHHTQTIIRVGSKVTLKHNNKMLDYQVVTAWEADPVENKISSDSPLGKALLGKKQGEELKVEVPAGMQQYNIIKVS
ncbi:MAG: transcription elongation factor GreA [Patescibacteria group bacterium]